MPNSCLSPIGIQSVAERPPTYISSQSPGGLHQQAENKHIELQKQWSKLKAGVLPTFFPVA